MTGAGVAKSAAVATTFFAPAASANPLVWIGLVAPAAAVTPVGWVVAAALAAGGGWYGVSRWLASTPDPFVDVILRFLNAPIDVLAMRLLDLHAALALRVAAVDGRIDEHERAAVRDHFEHDWGYDPLYLDAALPLIEVDAVEAGTEIERLATAITDFHARSCDCAAGPMQAEFLAFLRQVAEANGVDAAEEREALTAIERTIEGGRRLSLAQTRADLAEWRGTIADASAALGSGLMTRWRRTEDHPSPSPNHLELVRGFEQELAG